MPAALERLDRLVQERVLSERVVRVKLWTRDGRIVYSDEPRLIGAMYPRGDDEIEALRSGETHAELSDLTRPENRFERGEGKLYEVYTRVRTPNGTPLLFETYQRSSALTSSGREIWLPFAVALQRRHEAPAGPRLGARAPARGPVPRRAHDGARPRQPPHRLGRGPAHQREGHHRVPHHAVPRGGRPALCDRLAIIDDGKIVREGTPEQLKADLRDRLGLDSDPTLDDVFLDATGRTRSRVAGDVQEVS